METYLSLCLYMWNFRFTYVQYNIDITNRMSESCKILFKLGYRGKFSKQVV